MKATATFLKLSTTICLLAGQNTNAIEAHVAVAQNGTNFNYTLFNDDPTGSQFFLSNFHLEVNAPFAVSSTPSGWDFVTDQFSYVDWYCTNSVSPYLNDVAPGASLAGFALRSVATNAESLGYTLISWQPGATNSGPAIQRFVLAPSLGAVDAVLTNVFSPSNAFQFTLLGIPSFNYEVQSSTNLVDWSSRATNVSPFIFLETSAAPPFRRFYRARALFDVLSISQD